MSVDELLGQHVRILHAVEALERLAAAPRPEKIDGLSRQRWVFTRELMLHFGRMETSIYAPMKNDLRPDAATLATKASTDTAKLVADFRAHANRWRGFPADERWDAYCAALKGLMTRIRQCLDAEARLLTGKLLPLQPRDDAQSGPANNYATQAWEMRGLIYKDDQTPFT